jgi:predicted amidohydrolase YtcJ
MTKAINSRRRFLGASAAAAALGSTRLGFASSGKKSKRDIALVNGRIHTLDRHDTVVDSLLIRDGRFALVGGVRQVGDDTEVVNLRGHTVIPGIVDNHVHFIRIGNAAGHDERRLETAFTIARAQELIRARAAGVPEGEFITALAGIVRRQFRPEGRFPNLVELDDAAPRHPVLISEGGFGQANTLGRDRLRSLGVAINDDGTMPNHGPAYTALAQFLTIESRKRQLLYVEKYAFEIGLTTVMDMHGSTAGAGFMDRITGHDFYLELVREEALRIRTRVFFPEQNDLTLLSAILDNRWREFGSDRHKTVGIGEWAPRSGNYLESLRRIGARGWLYHQHLIGIQEIQAHLDAFRAYRDANPTLPSPAELHWNLGHVGDITESQVLEANELGVGLAPHPWRYLTGNGGGPRSRMIRDLATVPVGSGLDGARVAPLNPWAGIYYQTTGRNSATAEVAADDRISRTDALRWWCGPQQGWFTKEDHRLGGIAPGRFADLAVLKADVFDTSVVPDEQLRNMSSVLTVVGGDIVHDSGALG